MESEQSARSGEVAKLNARLNGIIFSAMDAIISIDAEQRIVLFNPAAERMFGIGADEVLGHHISRFIPERFRAGHASHVERFGHTGVSMRRMGALGTISGLRANGEEFPIEASISQVEVQGEKLFTVILRDITQQKRSEQALKEAMEKLAKANEELEKRIEDRTAALRQTIGDLEAFSYSLSHDLRAPLRAIRGLIDVVLTEKGANLDAEGVDLLKQVAGAAKRMDQLTLDLLALSRVSLQPMQLESVQPEKLLQEIIGERPELQPPRTQIRIESPLLRLRGHRTLLMQCLANLLGNAVKFVAPGTVPQVCIYTESVGANTRLWVADNGIGIPPEAKKKIFETFERLHGAGPYEGSGIGLAIVRNGVQRMGGSVGVESEPDKGSRFWIELPGALPAPQLGAE